MCPYDPATATLRTDPKVRETFRKNLPLAKPDARGGRRVLVEAMDGTRYVIYTLPGEFALR